MSGCVWYVGAKGCGKTTQAVARLWRQVFDDGRPALVLDCAGVCIGKAVDVPLVSAVPDVFRELYTFGRSCGMIPENVEQAEAVLRGIRAAGGGVTVLIDEAALMLASAHRLSPALDHLMRTSRHGERGGVTLVATSQRLADVHASAFAVADEIHVGRLNALPDLERARTLWGMDFARLQSLPRGEFVNVALGFDDKAPDVPHHGESPAPVA